MHLAAMLLLVGVLLVTSSRAQVGLRTAPLTAPRARDNTSTNSSSLGLFSSKWSGMELRHKTNNTSSIESSLAAIFRGVAYGVSTSHPSTTTTTSTHRPTPSYKLPQDFPPRDDYGYRASGPPVWSSQPGLELEVQQKAVTDQRGVKRMGNRPVQTPYIEAPVNTAPDATRDQMVNLDRPQEVEVVRADVGVGLSKVAWVRALGTVWVVHVYCAAGLYSLLALLALFWLARVHAAAHLLPRGYYITLHLLMFLAAFLRCVHLFHDPYGAERRLPVALSAVVEETGWPCLTAALAVVVLAIVRAWRCPRLLPRKPHAPLALALLTAAHLLASIAAHLTSALLPEHAAPLRAAARAVTAAWGGAVGIGGFLSVWRVGRGAGRHPGLLLVRLSRAPLEGTLPPRHPRLALLRGSHLTIVASLLQVLVAGLHMYALVGPHYIFELPPAYPWHWLAYQSTCRLLEVLMWVLLGVASTLTLGGSSGKRQNHKGEKRILAVFSCRRCGSCSSITTQDKVDEVFPAVCQTNQAVRNFTLQSCGKVVYQEALTQEPLARRANTVRVSHKRPSIRKSATLHSGTSDIHLLWNHGNTLGALPPDSASRPSSMLFNDAGFVRFRMQVDPQQGMDEVLRKSLQNLEIQADAADSKLLQQVPKDDPPSYDQSLYANTPQPEEKSPSAKSKSSPRYEDPYDSNQFGHLLQNRINSELYCGLGDSRHCRSDAASVTDYSSTDALSPAPTADNDWSKYASTCSSISAANSFDVRMYDDFEVAPYYQSSSTASSHVYASLHRPVARARLARQRAVYVEGEPAVHGYEGRQAVEQLTALLAPRTSSTSPQSDIHVDYLTDISHDRHTRGSDSDLCSTGSRHTRHSRKHDSDERPSPGAWRQPHSRRLNLHDITPDSAVVVDYAGHTDEASGDDGEVLHRLGQPLPPRPCLLTKIVKNNFSLNCSGYTPLGSEDVFSLPLHHQQILLKQVQQQNLQQRSLAEEKCERLRPCGHRPRKVPREDPKVTSPVKLPIHHRKLSPNEPLQKPTPSQEDEQHSLDPDSLGVTDGTTQTEPRVWPGVSPSSSRPASSLASHSDLPSECVDSEDDATYGNNHENPSDRGATPDLPTIDKWPSPTRLQAAV
ncbi:LOW QUALITY PROTEIN: uncharacterized protein [Procambarus clarkii]|uniref:LOW QUALITY PROTEIN: uncharacterized protein n=1 Tax=Procambarus clarkii TaxID=6728 RepID=UPI001E673553|nr:uncharacterized protein LOC123756886 [Procambarus clarkii]